MTTTTTTITGEVHKSRFGYHPVSLEVSRKLRFINGVYAKAQHAAAAWERYDHKAPQNRVLRRTLRHSTGKKYGYEVVRDANGQPVTQTEPEVCPVFHTKTETEITRWGSIILSKAVDNGLGEKVRVASRYARTPLATAEEVRPLSLTDAEIESLYEAAKAWLDR